MYRQDKWTSLNLKCKFHYYVLINIWYNGTIFPVLKKFYERNPVNIKRWVQSLFDFRPFYPDIVWEIGKLHIYIYTHVHVYI